MFARNASLLFGVALIAAVVNFALPANIVLGPGFGVISHTAGPSRQIQVSLKLLY
jgi:hypothetical protein